jgi:tetratricopeptide (TPR) repeat protein
MGCTAVFQNGQTVATEAVETTRRHKIDAAQVEAFSRSVRPIDGELQAKYELALHFLSMHKHRIAIQVLNEVVGLDAGHADAHNALGLSYDSLGDFEAARDHYQKALAISPDMDQAYNNLGYSYLLDGQFLQAIEALHQAIALNGRNARYCRNLGLAYLKINEVEMAALAFQVADGRASAGSLTPRLGKREKKAHQIDTQRQPEARANSHTPSPKPQTGEFSPPSTRASGARPSIMVQREQEKISRASEYALYAELSKASPKMAVLKTGSPAAEFPLPEAFGQEIGVEVSNGNGVPRMARSVRNHLRRKGTNGHRFRLTNADHFRYPKTIIYYRSGFQQQAQWIKSLLPELQFMGPMVEAPLHRDPIRLLIGKDLSRSRLAPKVNVQVDVTNGNGVSGMAKRVGELLARKGFFIGRITNADHFGYDRTLIFHGRGIDKEAEQVAAALPLRAGLKLVEVNSAGARIQVRFGADMVF